MRYGGKLYWNQDVFLNYSTPNYGSFEPIGNSDHIPIRPKTIVLFIPNNINKDIDIIPECIATCTLRLGVQGIVPNKIRRTTHRPRLGVNFRKFPDIMWLKALTIADRKRKPWTLPYVLPLTFDVSNSPLIRHLLFGMCKGRLRQVLYWNKKKKCVCNRPLCYCNV